ncbi:Protein of unknown function, partial [Gryllus bimaculatus]
MSIPDISKFNDDELVTFLNSFDTILTDCDGPGYIVDMLSLFTRRQPLIAAKPSRAVHEVVAARCPQMDPKRTLFIGDSRLATIDLFVSLFLLYTFNDYLVIFPQKLQREL